MRQVGISPYALLEENGKEFLAQGCNSFRPVVLPTPDILENWAALLPTYSVRLLSVN